MFNNLTIMNLNTNGINEVQLRHIYNKISKLPSFSVFKTIFNIKQLEQRINN